MVTGGTAGRLFGGCEVASECDLLDSRTPRKKDNQLFGPFYHFL
jgi:hypothetical protein